MVLNAQQRLNMFQFLPQPQSKWLLVELKYASHLFSYMQRELQQYLLPNGGSVLYILTYTREIQMKILNIFYLIIY
jgi:hypothetical protein